MGRKKKSKPDNAVENVDVVVENFAKSAMAAVVAGQDERIVRAAREAAHGYAFAATDDSVAAVLPVEGDVFTLRMSPRGARAFADSLNAAAAIAERNSEDDEF